MPGKIFLGRDKAIATEHPLASLAALRSFESGGNAFDAAASASFALSVTLPHLTGLGGDFFGLFYLASKDKVYCLNASGWSPSSFTVDRLKGLGMGGKGLPMFGHGSITVPGCVRGVYEMQRKFGRNEFSDCVKPAIEIASSGFPIGPYLVKCLRQFGSNFSPAAKKIFLSSDSVPPVGSVLRLENLAATLKLISEGGADAFYRGEPAEAIREEMAKAGFETDEKDFSSYQPEWCEPIKISYRGIDVFEVPPNSMGATSLLILKLLESHDLASMKPNSAERARIMLETAKVAYAAMGRQIGDPRFSKFDLDEFLASGVGPATPRPDVGPADTSYFAVADDEGNILSCIQSVFANFGSRVFVEKAGFFMNNRGAAFAMEGPNKLEPRKRPLHTLSALLLAKDGKPYIATGASGGGYRPQLHALLTTNLVDYGMDLETAVDYPRFLWDEWRGVRVERGYEDGDALPSPHSWVEYPGEMGVSQGVELMNECVKGVCDIRGEGLPVGE